MQIYFAKWLCKICIALPCYSYETLRSESSDLVFFRFLSLKMNKVREVFKYLNFGQNTFYS